MAEQITIDVQTGKTTVTYVPDSEITAIEELPINEPTTEERIQALEQELADLKSQLGV